MLELTKSGFRNLLINVHDFEWWAKNQWKTHMKEESEAKKTWWISLKHHDEKNQSNWETFKVEFKRDMDELGEALKDFGVKNTK